MKISRTLLLLALALTGNAVANESGPYLGFKGGAESITGKVSYSTLKADDLGSQGASYGAYIGYRFAVSQAAFMAVETEYMGHSTDIKYTLGSYSETISVNKDYGASLIVGHPFSERMNIYVIGGGGRAELKGKNSANVTDTSKVTRLHGGLGFEFVNHSNLSLRTEYRYTNYKKASFSYGSSMTDDAKAHSLSVQVQFNF